MSLITITAMISIITPFVLFVLQRSSLERYKYRKVTIFSCWSTAFFLGYYVVYIQLFVAQTVVPLTAIVWGSAFSTKYDVFISSFAFALIYVTGVLFVWLLVKGGKKVFLSQSEKESPKSNNTFLELTKKQWTYTIRYYLIMGALGTFQFLSSMKAPHSFSVGYSDYHLWAMVLPLYIGAIIPYFSAEKKFKYKKALIYLKSKTRPVSVPGSNIKQKKDKIIVFKKNMNGVTIKEEQYLVENVNSISYEYEEEYSEWKKPKRK